MKFNEFKTKLIERKKYLAMLEYSRSDKERIELNEKIAMLEKEISGRPSISELQFNSRLANFFQISKDDFIRIILPMCKKVGQKISYFKDERSGIAKGLRFEGFNSNYLYLFDSDNFSLKCLYDVSSQKPFWDELFQMFPYLEAELWKCMKQKSDLLNQEYAEILNEKLNSDRNLIIRLAEGKSKLREQEIAKLEKSNEKTEKTIESCKQGQVSIFD